MSTQSKTSNERTTPYERHSAQNHAVTRSSPNGIDTIEQCADCGARFLLQPGHEPVSMLPYRALYSKGDKAKVRAWSQANIDAQNAKAQKSSA